MRWLQPILLSSILFLAVPAGASPTEGSTNYSDVSFLAPGDYVRICTGVGDLEVRAISPGRPVGIWVFFDGNIAGSAAGSALVEYQQSFGAAFVCVHIERLDDVVSAPVPIYWRFCSDGC